MRRPHCTIVAFLVLIAVFGCDQSTVSSFPDAMSPETDGGVMDSAMTDTGPGSMPDTGNDAGSPAGLFEECGAARPCDDGLECATDFPRPFCTRQCEALECGDSGVCVGGQCLPSCRPGARDCDRVGGACAVGEISFCIATCGAPGIPTSNCRDGLVCDPNRGACSASIETRGNAIGAPCVEHTDCLSGSCFQETVEGAPTGWLGGYCVATTRYPGPSTNGSPIQSGCPMGTAVADTGDIAVGDIAFCMDTCLSPGECRDGYMCGVFSERSSTGVCLPDDCSAAGSMCPAGTSCQQVRSVWRCASCTPSCEGRVCGSDSCGGSCGACGDFERCTDAGSCECVAETDAQLCTAANAVCGALTVTDRCGEVRNIASCGTCRGSATCGAITPNRCDCVAETDAEICSARSATCGSVSFTDRCGRSRNVSCVPETCGGAGVANTCGICTPSCTGRTCGSNGCGGSCGSCGTGQRCTAAGQCEMAPCDPVNDTGCTTAQMCDWTGSRTECVAMGSGNAGTPCFGGDCASEHACSGEGFCREYCTSDFHCRSGECVYSLTGSSFGLCSRECNPDSSAGSSGCNPGEACRLLNTARSTEVTDCGEYGSAFEGDSCSRAADCFRGYTCVTGTCRRICTLGASCASGSCASVSGWSRYGVCPD